MYNDFIITEICMKALVRLFESKQARIKRERDERLAAAKQRRDEELREQTLRNADRVESRIGASTWINNLGK